MIKFRRAANAFTIYTHDLSLTFYQRAMSARGWTESWRTCDNWAWTLSLFGWQIFFTIKMPKIYEYRSGFFIYLPWGDYKCGTRRRSNGST